MYKAKREDVMQQIAFIDRRLLSNETETTQKRSLLASEANEEAIFTLQLQLESLMHMHKALIDAKARISAVIAPINLLSDETISYIFYLTEAPYRDDVTAKGERENLLVKYPSLLAEVCSRWRRIATSTPILWAHISFIVHNETGYPQERLWLERSKPFPLDVDIAERGEPETIRNRDMMMIFDILLPYFHRVEEIYIDSANHTPMKTALTRFPAFAPELQYLTLSSKHPNEGRVNQDAYRSIPILTEGAPKLLSAAFDWIPIAWHKIPAANLETLSLSNYSGDTCISWGDFTDFLKAIPRLNKLSFYDVIPRFSPGTSPSAWPQELTILPVTTITFIYLDVNVVIELLKRLVFPKANDVFLNVEDGSPALIDILRDRKVFATAKKFGVHGLLCLPQLVTEEMIKDSFGFPNVVELTIEAAISSPLVDALSNPEHLCFPKLQELYCYCPSGPRIRSILQARVESHKAPPMKRLGTYRDDLPPKEDRIWLRENVEKVIKLLYDREHPADSDLESDNDLES